jgi:hypothetical protein
MTRAQGFVGYVLPGTNERVGNMFRKSEALNDKDAY